MFHSLTDILEDNYKIIAKILLYLKFIKILLSDSNEDHLKELIFESPHFLHIYNFLNINYLFVDNVFITLV